MTYTREDVAALTAIDEQRCHSCQNPGSNHAMLWGCTCDAEQAEAARDYMSRVTR